MKKYCAAAICLLPTLWASSWATQPKLVSQAEIAQRAADTKHWGFSTDGSNNFLKDKCETFLDQIIQSPDYSPAFTFEAGFGWSFAAQDYGLCYNVAKYLNLDATLISNYSKKGIAMLKVLARHDPVPTFHRGQTVEFLALGDGSTKSFTLRMPPGAGKQVNVYLDPTTELTLTYTGTVMTISAYGDEFFPILKISDTPGGPAAYTANVDYHLTYTNELDWLGSHHPTGTFYLTTMEGNWDQQAAAVASVSGNTLTLVSAPPAGQGVFVKYMGPDYEQTGNYMGGVNSVRRDGPGYDMRTMGAGLALGYDELRESPDLTPALRQEFYTVMNGEIDWYTKSGFQGPHNNGPEPIGNYWIEGYLMATMYSAFATDDVNDNPRAGPGGDLKPLARSILMQTFDGINTELPGGYGPEGGYSEGTFQDVFTAFDVWKRATTADGNPEDFLPQLEWTANVVPATIHGTKPDRKTFYDGGDWYKMPPKAAVPLVGTMQAFIKSQPNHPMTPYARQLLVDTGIVASDPQAADYKSGPGAFPLSYLAKFSGPMYARSDWGTGAVWVSFASGPDSLITHQHRDQGHFTIQRGADYLVINAGGDGIHDTFPWENTLGFDDRPAGTTWIVYPPGQGYWGDKVRIDKFKDQGTFVYAQSDIANAYVNNGGVLNAVKRAVRTFVYIRPDIVLVHDRTLTANANVKKYLSVNFGGTFNQEGSGIYSSVVGQSKVFMRSLEPGTVSPTIVAPGTKFPTKDNAMFSISGTGYQLATSGRTTDNFMHLFQVGPSSMASMDASAYILSGDGREEGMEVNAGALRWIVMNSTGAPALANAGNLAYGIPQACPCTHVVGDLPPNLSNIPIVVVNGSPSPPQILGATNDKGVLTFSTDDPAATSVQILLSGGVADTLAPARPKNLQIR